MTDLMASRCCCVPQGPCTWTQVFAERTSYVVRGISGTYVRSSQMPFPPPSDCGQVCGARSYTISVAYSQEVPFVINRQNVGGSFVYWGTGQINVSGSVYIREATVGGAITGTKISERNHEFSRTTDCYLRVSCNGLGATCGAAQNGWFHELMICDFLVTGNDEGFNDPLDCDSPYDDYERGLICVGGGIGYRGPREYLNHNNSAWSTGWKPRPDSIGPFSMHGIFPFSGQDYQVTDCMYPVNVQGELGPGPLGAALPTWCTPPFFPVEPQWCIDLRSPCGGVDHSSRCGGDEQQSPCPNPRPWYYS